MPIPFSTTFGTLPVVIGLIAVLAKYSHLTDKPNKALIIEIGPTIGQGLLYLFLGFLPVFAWEIYRPRGINPNRMFNRLTIPSNLYQALVRLWQDWLSPMPEALVFLFLAAIAMALVMLFARKQLSGYLSGQWLIISYIAIYIIGLVVEVSIDQGPEGFSTRYMAPTYPFILVSVVPLIVSTYRFVGERWAKVMLAFSFLILAAFMGYQATSLEKYITSPLGFNADLGKDTALTWLTENIPDNAAIYSNCPELLQYKLRKIVYLVPMPDDSRSIETFFTRTVRRDNTYVVYLRDPLRTNRLSADQIREANQKYNSLRQVMQTSNVSIWKSVE